MSRTAIFSVLAASIVLASSADAADPKAAKKGAPPLGHKVEPAAREKQAREDLGKGNLAFAPAITASSPGIDLAPLDSSPGKGKIDPGPLDKHGVDAAAKERKGREILGKGNLALSPAVTASGPGVDVAPLDPQTPKVKIDDGPIVKHGPAPEPKGKKARQALGKGNVAFAPAVTAAGVGTDVAPLDPRDGTAVDVDPQAPTVIICFTDEMLRQYLHWLGVDLGTALRYGLLEDPRLISMFFDSLRRGADKAAQADAAAEDTWLVDFQPTR
jgi:hypothetical protein